MTSLLEAAQVDGRRLLPVPERRLSAAECHAWLSSHDEGRLSYLSGRGPRSVVVLYELENDEVVMRLPDYHDAAHYAPGTEVQLDVEGAGDTGREAVRLVGRALLADRAPAAAPDGIGPEFHDEASKGATSVICVPLSHIEGYETDLDYRE